MSAYDVIIIGTGAGGGTLARDPAPSGNRILMLERGGWLAREPQNIFAEEVFLHLLQRMGATVPATAQVAAL